MRKYLFLIYIFILFPLASFAAPTETLHYVISYKWGLIHKDTGDATITVTPVGNRYELKLTGMTRPWADRLFKVRDTLISVVRKDNFMPYQYTKIAHENGKYSRDDIHFSYNGNLAKGHSKKFRQKKDGSVKMSEQNLEGNAPVYDMLSVFFYLRNIDYGKLKTGETLNTTLFSGSLVEKLTVKCLGKEKIKLKDKSEREAWHIIFKFTSGGGKKSSDDIDCWISADSSHIPLYVVGSLPLGQVRCYYQP